MRLRCILLVAALAACTACAADGPATATPSGDHTSLTVFAAASLTDLFEAAARDFTAAYPEVSVTFEFAGSQQLARQLLDGARADVFASADTRWMAAVTAEGLVEGQPRVFAANSLAIAVEGGNPRGIDGLGDLDSSTVAVVLAAPQVPVGGYTAEGLARAGVELDPVSLELDARGVLGRVALGEADAGIVYSSDVVAAGGRVDGIPFPTEHDVTASYPVALLEEARNRRAAEDFVALLIHSDALLAEYGFSAL